MSAREVDVGDHIAAALAEIGVTRLFGRPFPASHPSLSVVPVDDDDLALLLADADGRTNNRYGAALIAGDILHVSSQPGGIAAARSVTSVEGAVAALRAIGRDDRPRTLALHLDMDLAEPVGDAELVSEAADEIAVTLSPSLADLSIVAVVGPGVTRGGHAAALAAMAAQGGIGVFNTWGAKGAFRWDSPFHFGTIGLQARDVEFAELEGFDIVVTSGLDDDELPSGVLEQLVTVDVAPWQLGALLADWPRAHRDVGSRPSLYDEIASIVTPLYERGDAPVTPPRAALHLSGAAPESGVVVADAGVAGFWLARTFPTGTPGSVVVPARSQPGFAAAAALVCGLDRRPCVAVTDAPSGSAPGTGLDEASEIVLDAARSRGIGIALQVWGHGSTVPEDHVSVCTRGFGGGDEVVVDHVGVDLGCIEPLVERFGPVTAWRR